MRAPAADLIDRDDQRPDQHDHLGDHEDLDVDPEPLQHAIAIHRRWSEIDQPKNTGRTACVVGEQQPRQERDAVHRQPDAD